MVYIEIHWVGDNRAVNMLQIHDQLATEKRVKHCYVDWS